MDCFCAKPGLVHVKIILLDEQELFHEVQTLNLGQTLLDLAFRHINLLETAYFGLRYLDQDGQTHWIDPNKKIYQQLQGLDPFILYFGVKFYAADPCKLLEEITRYQFFLQIKQDVLQGRLPVTFDLAAELGAYIVQSELGDYDSKRHSPGYVSEFRFLSNQTVELENRISELHRTLVGQLPSIAELKYLDKIKWLDMYGVDLHPVLIMNQGSDEMEYYLGLTPSGIIVLRNKTIIGNYYWPRISKIYFKGKYFMLKVTDKNNDESTYGFESPTKPACKHLWRCCVEHHAFFRLVQVSPTTTDIFALNSRFSGRTEKQAIRDAQMKIRSPPTFSRTPSRRHQRRIIEGAAELKSEESQRLQHNPSQEVKHVSIPQPAQSFDSPYKSTCAVSELNHSKADSPRSTRSAPWSQPHSRGLYNISVPPSPRSVHSAGPRYRSSSIDSQSSNDSRSCKRRRNHRSRWTSDNESELSKGSRRSHRKHRKHRSRGKRDSGSEQDSIRRRSKLKHSENHYELVDSEFQWQEAQKKQEVNLSSIQHASVISSNRQSGYMNSGLETESEASCQRHRRRHYKHRSRSRSPSDAKTWLSDELKKHLEFNLVDTNGMSEKQLREIPYTVVQTNHAKQLKLKHSMWDKSDMGPQSEKLMSYSPPPPYSPQPQPSDMTRLRGLRVNHYNKYDSNLHHNQEMQDYHQKNSSNAMAQSNSNMLPRMLDSLRLSDSDHGHQMLSHDHMLTNESYNNGHGDQQQFMENMGRINHEHTDSGLGTEHDLIYIGERSCDNIKQEHNMKPLSDHGIPLSTSVSKLMNSANIINPHDYYPMNPNKITYQVTYDNHTASLMGPKGQYDNSNVHMDGRFESSLTYKSYSGSVHVPNNLQAKENAHKTEPYTSAHINKRTTNSKPSRNCNSSSSNRLKGHLSAENNAAFLSHNQNFKSDSISSRNSSVTGHGQGPLRVQYQPQGNHFRASTRSERLRADNNNCVYNSNFKQLYNSNQNINNLHVATLLNSYDNIPGDQSNAIPNTHTKRQGESSEMSTEL